MGASGLTCGFFRNYSSLTCSELDAESPLCDCTGCCNEVRVLAAHPGHFDQLYTVYNTLVMFFVVIPAIWLLPTISSCGWKRLHRWTARQKAVPLAANDDTAIPSTLGAAEKARNVLQSHVKGMLWQAGWLCMVIFFTVMFAFYLNLDVSTSYNGAWVFFCFICPVGVMTILLGVSPVDSRAVESACRFMFGLLLFCGCVWITMAGVAVADGLGVPYALMRLSFGVASIALAPYLWPTLNVDVCTWRRDKGTSEREPMQPRLQLQAVWQTVEYWFISFGVLMIVAAIAAFSGVDFADFGPQSMLVAGIPFVLSASVNTSHNRGRFICWLNKLGKSNSAELEAACVASLLGNTSASSALANAAKYLRAMPLSRVTREHLMDKKPDPSMHALTISAKLGAVHAFASHSWTDDGNIKFEKMHEWAEQLDDDAKGDDGALVWLDKACIDQLNIEASLQSLPIFLSGCMQLLVLAGPTYTSRLWCVMELFVYVRMGGRYEDVIVKLLSRTDDINAALESLDASEAQCFRDSDRQRLLAVIEASFGTTKAFNKVVRGLFGKTVGSATKKESFLRRASTVTNVNKMLKRSSTRALEVDSEVHVVVNAL